MQLAWLLVEMMQHCADRSDLHATFVAFSVQAFNAPGLAKSGKSFHAAATDTLEFVRSCKFEHVSALLAHAAKSTQLPLHAQMLFAIAQAATDTEGVEDIACSSICDTLQHAFAATCGRPCQHQAVLSDLLMDACMPAQQPGCSTQPSAVQIQVLRFAQQLLLSSHCAGVSCQRLQLAPQDHPVVYGKSVDREMFVVRLQLPCPEQRATQSRPTASGWWLKLERCAASHGAEGTTYSLFLNNGAASNAAPVNAAFEIGVVANTPVALRKAEAAAVLIEQQSFMRPGLWTAQEAAIHRSAIRQEFSGTAWGIRHLCNDVALAQFGYNVASGPHVCVFGMVQL